MDRPADPFVIDANLDCEARWAGQPLPAAVATRASYYASLLVALAPDDVACVIHAPAAVDARRLRPSGRSGVPQMRVGPPPRADLRWAADGARPANDRRNALVLAAELGGGLPGARVVANLDTLDAAIATHGGRWVAKAPWTTAGRDRCHGDGPATAAQRTRLGRLLDGHRALVFEPWMDRVLDVGVCATVRDGALAAEAPHHVRSDARGGFLGIDLSPPALTEPEHRSLTAAVTAAAAMLARLGYAGPFAIDGFAYVVGGERRFHPVCELNARYTFGWVARGFQRRLGTTRLGFTPAPAEATTLIEPADDGVTAWIA